MVSVRAVKLVLWTLLCEVDVLVCLRQLKVSYQTVLFLGFVFLVTVDSGRGSCAFLLTIATRSQKQKKKLKY